MLSRSAAVIHPDLAHGRYHDQLLEIIGQEAQVTRDELSGEPDFAALGIDRVLSRSIVSSFCKKFGFNLPDDFLQLHSNTASLEQYFYTYSRPPAQTDPRVNIIRSKAAKSPQVSEPAGQRVLSDAHPRPKTSQTAAPSVPLAMRLQGNPETASRNIFLLPDGGGSAYSYIHLPIISPEVCLYALNSPYLTAPKDKWSIEDTVPIWLTEIRRVQPEGPYILGGWSAGGYYAFEVAKLLLAEGQQVQKVILIDSPCRLVFEALPMEVVQYLYDHNMLGSVKSKQAPRWLLDHFQSTIKAVDDYHPSKITGNHVSEVFIIWASDVVFPSEEEARLTGLNLNVKITEFMIEGRSDFGPIGWDKLFPGSKLAISKTRGNHFSLAFPPNAEYLGGLIRDANLSSCQERQNKWQYLIMDSEEENEKLSQYPMGCSNVEEVFIT